MTIETKFDLGQEVFLVQKKERKIIPTKIQEIRVSVENAFTRDRLFICSIYRINYDYVWVSERELFATYDEASDELAKWVEHKERMDQLATEQEKYENRN